MRKEITQHFMDELSCADYHIKWIFVEDDNKNCLYHLHFKMWDGFVISIDLDMFDFDEQQVIKDLREMIEQVYGGDY